MKNFGKKWPNVLLEILEKTFYAAMLVAVLAANTSCKDNRSPAEKEAGNLKDAAARYEDAAETARKIDEKIASTISDYNNLLTDKRIADSIVQVCKDALPR